MKNLLRLMTLLLLMIGLAPAISEARGVYMCSASFVSPDGYIATASHCVGASMTVTYTKNNKAETATARLVVEDKVHDVALLKIEEHNLPYFSFDTDYKIGDKITIWGWPAISIYGKTLKHYPGKIIQIDETKIYLYSFVAHGMSGGALVDRNGRAIGVTVAGLFSSSTDISTSLAVISKIEFLQILLASQGVVTLPTMDDNPAAKMVFLMGTID